jgi:hypothetical protein
MLLIRCSCQVYETTCTAAELPLLLQQLMEVICQHVKEHEDTRLLSRTANHLSTCEEHEHTLSKTANNCKLNGSAINLQDGAMILIHGVLQWVPLIQYLP